MALFFNSIVIFLTEAAQYECSYRRTAHHATAPTNSKQKLTVHRCGGSNPMNVMTLMCMIDGKLSNSAMTMNTTSW